MGTFCYAPLSSLAVLADGGLRPCPVYKKYVGHLDRVEDYFDPPTDHPISKLRQRHRQHEPPTECRKCLGEEEVSGRSQRLLFARMLNGCPSLTDEVSIRSLSIDFSNKCNLKCLFCSPLFSSAWIPEAKKLVAAGLNLEYQVNMDKTRIYEIDTKRLLPILDRSPYLEEIHFKGGEPLIHPQIEPFLDELITRDLNGQVSLNFVTNLTKAFSPSLLKRLKQFTKPISITVSADGTGPVYRYIRGGKYSLETEVLSNLLAADRQSNFRFNFHFVLCIYNSFNVADFARWVSDLRLKQRHSWKIGYLQSPAYLSPKILTPELKNECLKRISGLPKETQTVVSSHLSQPLKEGEHEDLLSELKFFCREVDRMRGTNLLSVIPELTPMFVT